MVKLGTALSKNATKVMMLGSGELGKEVVIELQRLGVEVTAVDRYANAPAMQVAHRSHVINMLDGAVLRALIEKERPHFIVPEIEALATDTLAELQDEGFHVVPTARATQLTMNREGIRRLVAEDLGIKTSEYRFADSEEEVRAATKDLGFPVIVKPIMSSSGKGQSMAKTEADIAKAWAYSQTGGRTGKSRVIVEAFVDFDYEITLLTIRHKDGTSFCEPIGHIQEDGDYRISWQPQEMSKKALKSAQKMAAKVTTALAGERDGFGLFGVELFIKGDEVIFSEVSPRPHDTGLVTLISQNLSEFALHARAILGLPIPEIELLGPSASSVILGEGESGNLSFSNLEEALKEDKTDIRLFGKPEIKGQRRLGVALARDDSANKAIEKAERASRTIKISYD